MTTAITARAAALSDHLQQRHGMFLNGVILVSAVLDFGTIRFNTGNDLPYVLFLPTYAVTAWYHGRLDERMQAMSVEDVADAARRFAYEVYAPALLHGSGLDGPRRAEVLEAYAALTGLPEDLVDRADLRVPQWRFSKHLLGTGDRTVGRLDSRFVGIDADATGSSPEYDPSYSAIQGPYTAALNRYVREELGYETDLPYEILTGRVRPWSWDRAENRYLNVAPDLRDAMTRNPDLRLFVANGYYDLATPFFAAEHVVRHLGLDESLRDHVSTAWYEAGHMMYIRLESLRRMRRDLLEFYADAARSGE